MKILTKKQCDEILKRITANEIIQIECFGFSDLDAQTAATENRAEIAFVVDGVKGMDKVKNTVHRYFKEEKRR